MGKRRASCACGRLVVACEGEPVRISMCHCLACQQRTGSVFGVQARFARDQVTVEGPSTKYDRVGDSGGRVTSQFCPTCGATVCWEIERMPDVIGVAVGAFADPSFAPPKVSVYEARRHPWAVMPGLDVEHMD
jgi:hypothetical protein